jgi:hypothetical protein
MIALQKNEAMNTLPRIMSPSKKVSPSSPPRHSSDANSQSPTRRRIRKFVEHAKTALAVSPSSTSSSSNHKTSMLDLCRKRPSICQIMSLMERFPDSLYAMNNFGQSVVHVAAARGAPADVVIFLAKHLPRACCWTDCYGMLPLHYVAQSANWILPGSLLSENIRDFMIVCDPKYLDMIKTVCSAHPEGVTQEDSEGKLPIEYALLHEAPTSVIRMLQAISQSYAQQKNLGCST